MRSFLEKSYVQYLLGFFIVLSALLCVFTPEQELMQRGAEFTVHLMLTLLAIGLFFMVFDQKRLMMVSLGASMFLAVFLKQASNSNLVLPQKNEQHSVSIAHINLSNINGNINLFFKTLNQISPDIISFQELTPDWHFLLTQNLRNSYPHRHSMVRIDYYGMAYFSKKDIVEIDTMIYEDIPNLEASLNLNQEQKLSIISSYMLPPLYNQLDLKRKKHFDMISKRIKQINLPVIALGDYNLTYWSSEIRNFKSAGNLENSRRDISGNGLRVPHDHIFYTTDLECSEFIEMINPDGSHLGIIGSYQIKSVDDENGRKEFTSKINIF